MNSKQGATLKAIFETPTSASIAWRAIESLLGAVGCETVEGKGSSVSFSKDGRSVRFHRPHPGKEAKKYQVEDARAFLMQIGVEPE